jgi:hypothetical protein
MLDPLNEQLITMSYTMNQFEFADQSNAQASMGLQSFG